MVLKALNYEQIALVSLIFWSLQDILSISEGPRNFHSPPKPVRDSEPRFI